LHYKIIKMNKIYLLIVFVFVQTTVFAQKTFKCFTCDSKPNLQFSMCFENDKAIYVKYKGQDETMELLFLKTKNPKKEVATYIETYNEMYRGAVNGTYTITHSGNYDYVVYTRKKDGKKFEFTIDLDRSVINEEYRKTPCY
jgi:hypothetical protein